MHSDSTIDSDLITVNSRLQACQNSIPDVLRQHGLQTCQEYPRVGKGDKATGVTSRWTQCTYAWNFPYIDMITAGPQIAALVFDCDDRIAMASGLAELPEPNAITFTERGAHIFFFLQDPVARHPNARHKPLAWLEYIYGFYAFKLRADVHFTGLSRNPVHPRHETHYGARHGYTLDQLGSCIDANYVPVTRPATLAGIGRNSDIFMQTLQWAGKKSNLHIPVHDYVERVAPVICAEYGAMLPDRELRDIARSVERYRDKWRRLGWHCARFIARQRTCGRMSGNARREKNAERDRTILQLHEEGQSLRSIASQFGITHPAVIKIIKRDKADAQATS